MLLESKEKITKAYNIYIIPNLFIIDSLSNALESKTKNTIYTIAKKYLKGQDEGLPVPGSLEEDLSTPDNFFESHLRNTLSLPNITDALSTWKQLTPVDIFAKAQHEIAKRGSVNFSEAEEVTGSHNYKKISYKAPESPSNRDETRSLRKNTKKKEVTDEEILNRYTKIKEQIIDSSKSFNESTAFNIKKIEETKQQRFFDSHSKKNKGWNAYLTQTSLQLGREPRRSVLVHAEGFREKIERRRLNELSNPTAHHYGMLTWQLGLRSSPKFKDTRHYALAVGGNYAGLFVQVTETPTIPQEMVRGSVTLLGKTGMYSSLKSSASTSQLGELKKQPGELQVSEENLAELAVIFLKQ